MRQDSPHLLSIEVSSSINKTTTQSGIHERGILCCDCDRKIGVFDDYAYTVLPAKPDDEKFLVYAPRLRLYALGDIDVEKFRWFLVSLAWRSAVAKHPLFDRVELGPYEEQFRQALLKSDLNAIRSVTAVVSLFQPPKYDRIILQPSRSKYDGINVLQFYLYPWKLLVKVDKRDFADPFDKLALSSGKPAFAFVHDFLSLGEIGIINDLKQRLRTKPET